MIFIFHITSFEITSDENEKTICRMIIVKNGNFMQYVIKDL